MLPLLGTGEPRPLALSRSYTSSSSPWRQRLFVRSLSSTLSAFAGDDAACLLAVRSESFRRLRAKSSSEDTDVGAVVGPVDWFRPSRALSSPALTPLTRASRSGRKAKRRARRRRGGVVRGALGFVVLAAAVVMVVVRVRPAGVVAGITATSSDRNAAEVAAIVSAVNDLGQVEDQGSTA